VTPLLTDALHNRFAAFAELADIVSGLAQPPVDAPPVDVHELRIDGKAVRYAFELAAAHGLPVPKKVAKIFKSMQDALGDWHDEVVLAERILRIAVDTELPLHRPALAASVLDVARSFLQRSERSLSTFKAQWKRSGDSLRQTLAERVPLVTDATPTVVEPIGDAPAEVAEAAADAAAAPSESVE
jgi:CHAD domain-containing protein